MCTILKVVHCDAHCNVMPHSCYSHVSARFEKGSLESILVHEHNSSLQAVLKLIIMR